jgi:hypothetical protein
MTKELMGKLEKVLNERGVIDGKLEWVAVMHSNTDVPHVHVALRGVVNGKALRIPPDIVKGEMRRWASDYCTNKLGYRTHKDAAEALVRKRKIQEAELAGMSPSRKHAREWWMGQGKGRNAGQ